MISLESLKVGSVPYNMILSLLVFLIIIGVKVLINSGIQKAKHLTLESKRKWVIRTRTYALLLFVLAACSIWSHELRTFALSIAALAAAIAIATKEFILSFCGTLIKAVSHSFSHGDRIEIDGIRGDVVDQSLLSTTVLEIGPGERTHQYTGRSIVIPNMLFLTMPLKNETFFHDFVLHTFTVPRRFDDDLEQDEQDLLDACQMECGRYIASAQQDMNRRTRKKHLASMGVSPRVTLKLISADSVELVVRVATPFQLKGKIENAIIKRFIRSLKSRKARAQLTAADSNNSKQEPASTIIRPDA